MILLSAYFPLLVGILAAAYWKAPPPVRPSILVALNQGFILVVMPTFSGVAYLLAFVAGVYWLMVRTKRSGLVLTVVPVLAVFVWLKSYAFIAWLPIYHQFPTIVGLSFVLFRCLHLLVDINDGSEKDRPTFWQFLGYVTYWPCLLSGPIQFYQEYRAQVSAPARRLTPEQVYDAISLMVSGYFFAVFLAGIANSVFARLQGGGAPASPVVLGVSAVAYLVFLYFNFAGYTRIVCGMSMLFGITLPDNFDQPWKARGLLEFWNRWHISLGRMLRTYVFTPTMRLLGSAQPRLVGSAFHGVIATFVTFVLIGVWHGGTFEFFAYGLVLGVGACVDFLYQTALRSALGKVGVNKLNGIFAYQLLCGVLTLTFMAVSIMSLWMDGRQIEDAIVRDGMLGVSAALIAAASAALPISLCAVILDRSGPPLDLLRQMWARSVAARRVIYVALLLLQALATPISHNAFIYQRF